MPKHKHSSLVKLDPNQNQVTRLIGQGFSLHQQGKLTEAQAIYEQLLTIEPNHFDAQQLLGALFNQTREFAKAVDFLTRALHINPKQVAY